MGPRFTDVCRIASAKLLTFPQFTKLFFAFFSFYLYFCFTFRLILFCKAPVTPFVYVKCSFGNLNLCDPFHTLIHFYNMRETLKKLRDALRPIYGDRETEAIIRIIFHHLKGWNSVDMIMHEDDPLSHFVSGEIDGILFRLLNHEPIQYITGEARFHGMDFHVTPDVLIPRPETDQLVDLIIDNANDAPDLKVLDIGTGSGCIAIALARNLPFSHVSAIDISSKAIDVAKENANNLNAKINFIQADIFKWSAPDDSFDIIVSNPPYIDESEKSAMEHNVLDFEPHSALFVPDSDPLLFYHRITLIAKDALTDHGRLYFEINPRHASQLKEWIRSQGFDDVEIIKDAFEKDRFISASIHKS